MKKVVLYIILLCLPSIVYADMGAPVIAPYYAVITNPNGIKYIDSDTREEEVLPYGTRVKVVSEYIEEGSRSYAYIEFDNQHEQVSLKDIAAADKEYKIDINSEFVKKLDVSLTILNKSGRAMYKGPAYGYDKVGLTIPYYETVDCFYGSGDSEEGDAVWAYVEYKGQKGWIYFVEGNAGIRGIEPIKFSRDMKIVENPIYSDAKVLGTLPAYKEVIRYYELDIWAGAYYVDINGLRGYVDKYNVYEEKNGTFDVPEFEEIPYYAEPYGEFDYEEGMEPKPIGYLEEKSKIKIVGFTEPDKYNVWYKTSDSKWFFINYDAEYEVKFDEEEPSLDDDDNHDVPALDDITTTTSTTTAITTTEKIEENESDESNLKDKNPMITIYLCVGAAIIVALTSLVIIILINKKKKNKKDKSIDILQNDSSNRTENVSVQENVNDSVEQSGE